MITDGLRGACAGGTAELVFTLPELPEPDRA